MLNRFRYYELDLNKTSHSYFNLSENLNRIGYNLLQYLVIVV